MTSTGPTTRSRGPYRTGVRRREQIIPAHPVHAFIQRRYTDNLATLAGHLRQAVDAGEIAALSPAAIGQEVRLVTAVLDGIGLQWLLDPSTDVSGSVETYISRTVASWRSSAAT